MNNQDVIGTLNGLLQTTNDGAMGFRTCAKDVRSVKLTPIFEAAAKRCDVGAAELAEQIRRLGGEPTTSGSVGGAVQRTWTDIISSLTGMDEHAVLKACERAEDTAKRVYETALEADLPVEIKTIVSRQYAGVKENHDRIRMLRDETAS